MQDSVFTNKIFQTKSDTEVTSMDSYQIGCFGLPQVSLHYNQMARTI